MLTVPAAFAALALAAPAASAADPRGKTEQGPQNSNSICSYSGLNDDPNHAYPEDGQVQSYGQLVKRGLKDFIPSPSDLCNAHNLPWQDVTGSH